MSWNQRPLFAGQRTRSGHLIDGPTAHAWAELSARIDALPASAKASRAALVAKRTALLRAAPLAPRRVRSTIG